MDCIHFVQRKQLALLEFVMKGCPREDIAIMARRRSGNMGSAASSENPFVRAEVFLKHRMEAVIGEEGEVLPPAAPLPLRPRLLSLLSLTRCVGVVGLVRGRSIP